VWIHDPIVLQISYLEMKFVQDLVWLNVRNYCGMVLDRETGAVLGTAVLFIPTDSNRKSAWVTSVNTVEGRWEVVIKDSKGEIQEATLMLTSTAFGLAFFSARTWQKTFALAFLRRSSLRLWVAIQNFHPLHP
jgi:hypothetical protein